jgi:hypothetical protein
MKNSDTNIDGSAALVTAGCPAFGLITVTARLIAILRARRWVYGALNNGNSRLGLNLRNQLGAFLRKGCGYRRDWEWSNLHRFPRLTSKNLRQFSHMRNEQLVNLNGFKMMLSNSSQMANLIGFFAVGVRP